MARDIVVTTPKGRMEEAAWEAKEIIEAGGGRYFRRLASSMTFDVPLNSEGSEIVFGQTRVYYVEDGYLRGYCLLERITLGRVVSQMTGREWPSGVYAVMDATTWKWIKPVPMRGFRGWQFLPRSIGERVNVVGWWLDPRPVIGSAGPLSVEVG